MDKPKVLIVDDFPDNVFLLEEIISSLGFESDSVNNGELAVEAVRKNDYKIVFMDIEMPIMNGFEASEEIRERPGSKSKVLIIASWAQSREFFFDKVRKTGIDDYISKPYTQNKIVSVLQRHGVLA